MVKIGLSLGAVRPDIWTDLTRAADELGYESVWMPEHLVLPVSLDQSPFAGSAHSPIPPNIPVFDSLTFLAYLAGQTEQIHFGTQIYNIGLRHPFVVARAVATLDVVSRGRLEFGVGASWLEGEWIAAGLDFATRGRRVDEAIAVCQRLWSETVIEHHGEFFDFGPVMFEPKPVQSPWPRLHIGGDGPAALRRAATVGDGWIPMNHSLDEVRRDAATINKARRAQGKEHAVEITFGANGCGLDELRSYADAGIGRILVKPWTSTKDALDATHNFAETVLPEIVDYPVAAL
jgi:probable F420-dependent oxidoreductase